MGRKCLECQGGSGFKGVIGELLSRRVCMCGGMGRNREQLLSFRNIPSLSDASSDCKIAGNLHGRGMVLLLTPLYSGHWNMIWWRVCRCGRVCG